MITTHSILSFSLMLSAVLATIANAKADDAEILRAYAQSPNVQEAADITYLESGNPQKVWDFFTSFYWRNSRYPESANTVRRVGQAVAKNVALEVMLEEKLKPTVTGGFQKRMGDLIYLGGVPAPWSARILGVFLTDVTPMEPQEQPSDRGDAPNQELAAQGLSAFGFSDGPTKGMLPQLGEEGLKNWQNWWKANEGRIDQRIAEINPGYYYRTPAPTPAIPAPTSLAIEEYPSTPSHTKPTDTRVPGPTLLPVVDRKQSDSIIYIIGGIVVIAVLAGVAWTLRRRV